MPTEPLAVTCAGAATLDCVVSPILLLRDLGGNQEGTDGATVQSSPVDGGDYYSFDGVDDGFHYGVSSIPENSHDGHIRFRVHDRYTLNITNGRILWKSGSNSQGIGVGFHVKSGSFGLGAFSSSTYTYIRIPQFVLKLGRWYDFRWSVVNDKIYLKDLLTGETFSKTGSIAAGDSSGGFESIGYSSASNPVGGGPGSDGYCNCDVDFVKIYDGGSLPIPTGDNTAPNAEVIKLYIGDDRDGDCDYVAFGTSNQGTYYYFDGTAGLYDLNGEFYDDSKMEFEIRFRAHDKNAGSNQTIFKGGSENNGVAIGINTSGDLGIYGRSGGTLTSIKIASANYSDDVWYIVRASHTKIELQRVSDGGIQSSNTGTVTASEGNDRCSVSYSSAGKILSGTSGTGDYFEGDIGEVFVWDSSQGGVPFVGNVVYQEASTDTSSTITFTSDATGNATRQFSATLSGAVTLAANLSHTKNFPVTLSGTGTVNAELLFGGDAITVGLEGSGFLTADLTKYPKPLDVSISGTGTLAAALTETVEQFVVSLSASASVSCNVSTLPKLDASLSGSASLEVSLRFTVSESVSDTLTFSDDATDSYKLVLPYLVDPITFTSDVVVSNILTIDVSNVLNLTGVATRNSISIKAVSSTLGFTQDNINYTGITDSVIVVNLKEKTYVVLEAPFEAIDAVIILPNPLHTDTENLISSINLRRSMNNKKYTYVKSSDNRILRYTFTLNRNKALELQDFFRFYNANFMKMSNWKGEIWKVQLKTNPIDFSQVTRYSPTGARVDVNLEFEGTRVYA